MPTIPFDFSEAWEEFLLRAGDDMQTLIPKVREKLGTYEGLEMDVAGDGKLVKITMSGLLGLVWKGGMRGAESWLKNSDDRSKYPNTTKTFLNVNGLF